jgi:hypothetical protein
VTGVYQGYVAAINSRLALGTRLTEVLETWNTFDWVVAYVHIAVLRALIWSSWSTKYNKLGRFLFKKRLFSVSPVSQEYRVYCIFYTFHYWVWNSALVLWCCVNACTFTLFVSEKSVWIISNLKLYKLQNIAAFHWTLRNSFLCCTNAPRSTT